MKVWQLTLIFSFFISTQTWANVRAYFNHNPSTSYTDPYRGVRRAGDNLEQVLIDQVAKARSSILIAVQEFRLPLLANALIQKKAQGVDVRVVLEHDYNFNILTHRGANSDGEYEASRLTELVALIDLNRDGRASKEELESRDAVYMLTAAGIPIMDDTSNGSKGGALMHHKFMIVDGLTTVISSANFTLSCIHGDLLAPASRGNANSMVVVQSTAVAQIFQEEFLIMWGNGKQGTFGNGKPYRGPRTVNVNGSRLIIQFSPTSKRVNWVDSVNGLIAQVMGMATKSINAALFVYSDQNIGDVVENRNNVGVKVGFLVESKFAFREYSELLDMAGLQVPNQNCRYEPGNQPWKNPGKEIGVPILTGGDVLHHKFAVVDNRMVVMGSENWSDSANFSNDETVVVIENPAISDQYTQEYNRLKKLSRMGVPATVQSVVAQHEARCAGRAF